MLVGRWGAMARCIGFPPCARTPTCICYCVQINLINPTYSIQSASNSDLKHPTQYMLNSTHIFLTTQLWRFLTTCRGEVDL